MSKLPLKTVDRSSLHRFAPISASNWVSTFLGVIREATSLTPEEEAAVETHLDELMSVLNVDDMIPHTVPVRVWAEHHFHTHSREFLTPVVHLPSTAPASPASNADWVAALTEMLFVAYPTQLTPEVRVLAAEALGHIVNWLNLEARPIRVLPEEVLALSSQG